MDSNCEGLVFVKDVDPGKLSLDLISPECLVLENERKIFVKSNMYDFSNGFYVSNRIKTD